jgi:transglutaminase-like putative cysteine protease
MDSPASLPSDHPANPFLHPPMNFHVTCELDYTLQSSATFLFALRCIETGGQQILSESLVTDPFVTSEEFTLTSGMNRFSRIKTLNPGELKISYQADVSTSIRIVPVDSLSPDGPGNLSPEAIPFLFPSRYCQSDRLRQQAVDMFGHLNNPHAIASGVSDWIFEHVNYVSGSSGETSSAIDTLEQRQGVCRDFAHLAIAFCRAMNVPARYATCYAYQLDPPDFHACFEVFIDGWWYIFDPTRLAPLNGLVRIATGRDAADAAVCTIFGNPELTSSSVTCECSDQDFIPITRDSLVQAGEVVALL